MDNEMCELLIFSFCYFYDLLCEQFVKNAYSHNLVNLNLKQFFLLPLILTVAPTKDWTMPTLLCI